MRASEKKDDQDRDGHSARFEAQSDSASEDGVSTALEEVRSAAHALHVATGRMPSSLVINPV